MFNIMSGGRLSGLGWAVWVRLVGWAGWAGLAGLEWLEWAGWVGLGWLGWAGLTDIRDHVLNRIRRGFGLRNRRQGHRLRRRRRLRRLQAEGVVGSRPREGRRQLPPCPSGVQRRRHRGRGRLVSVRARPSSSLGASGARAHVYSACCVGTV